MRASFPLVTERSTYSLRVLPEPESAAPADSQGGTRALWVSLPPWGLWGQPSGLESEMKTLTRDPPLERPYCGVRRLRICAQCSHPLESPPGAPAELNPEANRPSYPQCQSHEPVLSISHAQLQSKAPLDSSSVQWNRCSIVPPSQLAASEGPPLQHRAV